MTNLLIGYPDIPSRAINWKTYTDITSETPNEHDFMPAYNTFRGYKWQGWGSGYERQHHSLVHDLGSGNERSASFLYIANSLRQRSIADVNYTIRLERSSDDSAYTTVSSEAIDSATLIGARSEDYLKLFTQTSNYRYWRTRFTTSGIYFQNYAHKIYFGNMFDMGTDSYTYSTTLMPSIENEFKSSTGSVFQSRTGLPHYEVEISWNDVTDVKAKSFYDEIAQKRHNTPIFLYTADSHAVLDGKRLLFGYITEVVSSNPDQILDRNTISIRFVEDPS